MLHLCFLINIGIVYSTSEFVQDKSGHSEIRNFQDGGHNAKTMPLQYGNHETNATFIDREENVVRIPNKVYENGHKNTKLIKTPKRTIQKIIRKGKSKTRRIYVHPISRITTTTEQVTMDEYSQEDVTTDTNRRRKAKTRKSRVFRNQMPFHKFQSHKKSKRDTKRELYILKDLDEIEFMSNKDDYNVINTHVKKYW